MVRRVVPLVRSSRRRGMTPRRLVLGPLAAAALVLAACGSDDAGGTPTTTTVAAPTAEQSATGSAGATEPAPATADGKVAASDSMMALQPVDYVYQGDMPALDGPAQAWRWTPGRAPTAEEIAAVAAALGVAGDVIEQPADMGGGWAVGVQGAHRLTVSQDAQGSWSFIGDIAPLCMDDVGATSSGSSGVGAVDVETLPAPAPDEPTTDEAPADGPATVAPPETVPCVEPVGIPTTDEARATATELLQALGLDPAAYEITADSQEWGAWVDARLLVDGLAAPALTSFGFGAEGALTFASGHLFGPEPADQYERVGTAAALEQLQADQFRSYSPAVDPAATDIAPLPATEPADPDTPVSSPEAQLPIDSGNPIETGAPADATRPIDASEPAEPVTIVLTGVKPGWWMIWAGGGTIWLLPGYDFLTDQGEGISAPAVAQIDMPVVETKPGAAEPAIGAGEGPSEADIAPPLGD